MQKNKTLQIETPELKSPIFLNQVQKIAISVEEYARLKDIETRFAIIRDEMLHASYCPIHHQIILGIEKEYTQEKGIENGFDAVEGGNRMKNYELIALLMQHPAGSEIKFSAVVSNNNNISTYDEENSHVEKSIEYVDSVEENQIYLS